jgi:GTP cyclohydrolase I
MKEIQAADWIQKITGDKAPLDQLREWEPRIVAAYSELLDGYDADPSEILNDIAHVQEHPGLVIERDIQFTSMCYHHFLPFFGAVDVVYEPMEIITGLGRIVELVQALAHRFQIQEFLVRDIAHALKDRLNAKGVFVRCQATHLCIHSRGPNDRHAQTVCTYALGSLETIEHQMRLGKLI